MKVKKGKITSSSKANSSDDDFVSQPVFDQVEVPVKKGGIAFRNPSGLISEIFSSFNDNQKSTVNEIGFGFIGDFVVKKFGRDLCFWILENYDEKRNVLCVNNQVIHITKKSVHDIYGLPMGNIPMILPIKSRFGDPIIKKWRDQFGKDKERIRLVDLKNFLEKSTDFGEMFILNFLVAYVTIMIDAPAMGTCNQKFLENFNEHLNVKEFDWCGFVIECLKESKKGLNLNSKTQYAGPVAFLVVSLNL